MVAFVCTTHYTHMQKAVVGIHEKTYPQFALGGGVSEGHLTSHCCCAPQRPVPVGMRGSSVCLRPHIHLPSGRGGVLLSGNSAKVLSVLSLSSCFHSYVAVRPRQGNKILIRMEDMGK